MQLPQTEIEYRNALIDAAEGLIKGLKDGPRNASVRISRIEIETVAKTANRASYLTIQERN